MVLWRDIVWECRFRGVPFIVLACEEESGRALVRHPIPQRKYPHWQDMGVQPRVLSVTGCVIGDDYLDQKRKLQRASEQPGAADLALPYFGLMLVRLPEKLRFTEQSDEGRMARFTCRFEEASDVHLELTPAGTLAQAKLDVADAASKLEQAAAGTAGAIDVAGPEIVRTAPATVVRDMARKIQSLNVFNGPSREVADFASSLNQLVFEALTLVTAPADLAAQVLGVVQQIEGFSLGAKGALEAYRSLAGQLPPAVPGLAPWALQAGANAAALAELVNLAAMAGEARAASSVAWATHEDALEARGDLMAAMDLRMETAGDEAFLALSDLRRAVFAAIPPPGQQLPRVARLALPGTIPALALAYELYEDATRDEDLISRNPQVARNPLFLNGTVQVLVEP